MIAPLFQELANCSEWTPITSGAAKLNICAEGRALRLDYDFQGSGGFVVARRQWRQRMPESFRILMRVRALGKSNAMELKFEDPSHYNVWRFGPADLAEQEPERDFELRRTDLRFAWGPLGGGRLDQVGAIELVIVARAGGQGTMWLDALDLDDRTSLERPLVSASSSRPGSDPRSVLASDKRSWSPAIGDSAPWWQVDFNGIYEPGGLTFRWGSGQSRTRFEVDTSLDGVVWQLAGAGWTGTRINHVRLTGEDLRCVRIRFPSPGAESVHVEHMSLMPVEASADRNSFLHEVAAQLPRGWMPRYWRREQSYWTSTGTPDGGGCPIINQEGMIEPFPKGFSIEPFLYFNGRLITWAEAAISVSLAEGWLPFPRVEWQVDGITLHISTLVSGTPGERTLHVRYEMSRLDEQAQQSQLLVCLRPFQVSPTWQQHGDLGGAAVVRDLRILPTELQIEQLQRVIWDRSPHAGGTIASSEGTLLDLLSRGEVPDASETSDEDGMASAVIAWNLFASNRKLDCITLAIPLDSTSSGASTDLGQTDAQDSLSSQALMPWKSLLGNWRIELSNQATPLIDAWRTACAHILIHRKGVAYHPGPRRYARCWIRDATTMMAALLRSGCGQNAAALLRWYASYQRDDGFIPCCVDAEGPDWLVEHDSHGQFLHALYDCVTFLRDEALLHELWPAALRTARYLQHLILPASECGAPPTLGSDDRMARLLPESASHEGYLAHPVHSFWDDFWALRGLRDAVHLARWMNDAVTADELTQLCQAFERAVAKALTSTIVDRHLDFVPGSVEWADFDPTATSVAISLLHQLPGMDRTMMSATFDRYLAGFRDRLAGRTEWSNYSAYEIRIVGALMREGRRTEALEVLNAMFTDRRPRTWNQWPEISWRDASSPGHLGDVPHTWIGAEYSLAVRDLFVYERGSDEALVIAAGLPIEWLVGSGVCVKDLPTRHGLLNYTLCQDSPRTFTLKLEDGLTLPSGGIVIEAPVPNRPRQVTINGVSTALQEADPLVLSSLPAEVVISWSEVENNTGLAGSASRTLLPDGPR